MDGSDFQVAVLGIVLLHSCVGSGVLGVFFHVVKLLMRDEAGCGDSLTNVLGKRDAAFAAVQFPSASVFAGQKILVAPFVFR